MRPQGLHNEGGEEGGSAKKLYGVLGVDSTATASELKRAYHKLALRYREWKRSNPANAPP